MFFKFKKTICAIPAICYVCLCYAQCGAGTVNAKINFDWQYFDTVPAGSFNFMLGKSSMQLKWTGSTNTFLGTTTENNHSGESGSYGSGNDLKFLKSNNVTDTLLFRDSVYNLQFSIYDLDNSQGLSVTATNAAGIEQNITMSKVSGSVITISGSGGTTPSATTSNTNTANTATTGTVNIAITGWVNKVVLRYTKTNSGSTADTIFMSDISACLNNTEATWAQNYQSLSTPEAGQPSYTLATYSNHIYVVNLTNNTSSILYTDPDFTSINSLAYDPVNQVIYYTNNARTSTNKSIYKYDVKSGVRSVFIADVTSLGILLRSTAGSFLGSGSAAFYNGSLFIGTDANTTMGDACSIYRIDINAQGQPTGACRFWARSALPNISTRFFDWSDFVIKGGVAYCFNQANTPPANLGAYHMSLNLQDTIAGYTTTTRNQVSMDYNENIYHMRNYGSIEMYNENGTFSAIGSYNRINAADSVITDGGEAFKYPYDYGKDSANYGVAYHMFRTSPDLMLGSTVNYAASNSGDTASDNDGTVTFPELTVANASYGLDVNITNSTGSPAFLYGYIDFNRDGDFDDPGERSESVIISNGATTATIIWTGMTGGSVGTTLARLRLAPAAEEAGSPSGYGSNGETEDYNIIIGPSSLPVTLTQFYGKPYGENNIKLYWQTASELNNKHFEIEHSPDGLIWKKIGEVKGNGNTNFTCNYSLVDKQPNTGNNYYRLKQVDWDNKTYISKIINIQINPKDNKTSVGNLFSIYPNPTHGEFWIYCEQEFTASENKSVQIYNLQGDVVYSSTLSGNYHRVNINDSPDGLYLVRFGLLAFKIVKDTH